MIKGIGVDIIEISRIEKAAGSERFMARVFRPEEITDCPAGRAGSAALAGRFAAKEAAAKALGTGIGRIKWTDIEVTGGKNRPPEIVLHGAAYNEAERLGITKLALSISHAEEYAVAFVVAY